MDREFCINMHLPNHRSRVVQELAAISDQGAEAEFRGIPDEKLLALLNDEEKERLSGSSRTRKARFCLVHVKATGYFSGHLMEEREIEIPES